MGVSFELVAKRQKKIKHKESNHWFGMGVSSHWFGF